MCGACTSSTDEQADNVPAMPATPAIAAIAVMDDIRLPAAPFALEGVTCGGCASSVTAAAHEIPGVRTAEVDLATDTLGVTTAESETYTVAEHVRTAVRTADYGIR